MLGKLVQLAKRQGQIDGVWYGGGNEFAGQDRCVEFTGQWVEQLARHPDKPFSISDCRFIGFKQVYLA